jgi:ribosomal protein S27E
MTELTCPSCGSPVTFRSKASVYASCPSCRSLLIRHDVDLEARGKVADLQDDGTPLQVGSKGSYQGQAFEILGRLQVVYPAGFWNEWFLQFQDGSEAWLGEAAGEYFLCQRIDPGTKLPPFEKLSVGDRLVIASENYVVTRLDKARVVSFEGELPFLPQGKYELPAADLRSGSRRAVTLDYSEDPPLVFRGLYLEAEELNLSGLRDRAEEALLKGPQRLAGRVLRCPSCGAPHELHGGPRIQVLVCTFCGTALDLSDPSLAILWKAAQAEKFEPLIPLGTKGKLRGKTLECIAFLRRQGEAEDGTSFFWHEYLLFDPLHGYRWLTEYEGHWNLVKEAHSLPTRGGQPVSSLPQPEVRYLGRSFRHFQSYSARIAYVIGELYWRAALDDRVQAHDFVDPPLLLSAEQDKEEIHWSLGEYIPGEEVWRAFSLPDSPPPPRGVFPNQPSPYRGRSSAAWTWFGIYALLALVAMLGFSLFCRKETVFDGHYTFPRYASERSFVTPTFPLKGRTSNVVVVIDTDLNNRWAWFDLALINTTTGQAFNVGDDVAFYSGSDADGPWSEGNRKSSVVIPMVPSGTYYLRVEPQSGTGPQADPLQPPPPGEANPPLFSYSLSVYRDVPRWSYFWILLGVLLVPPIFMSMQAGSFEHRRWSESDHPPTGEEE